MNDLVVKDTSLYLAGHIFTTTIFGRMVKIDATDGSMEWTQDYGNYPGGVNQYSGLEQATEGLVFNECWGIAENSEGDGMVMTCGTGVEECDMFFWNNFLSGMWAECKKDPRKIWRALTIATDLDGERVWSRQDSFYDEGAAGSAGEYVITTSDGGTVIITDETMGFGFLFIDQFTDEKCDDEFSAAWRISAALAAAFATFFTYM